MKKNSKLLLILSLISIYSCEVYAFSIDSFWEDLVKTKPGIKAIDNEENLDLEPYEKPNSCSRTYPWGEPRIKDKSVNSRSLYLCNTTFSVQFDPKLKVPLWTSEVLMKDNFEQKMNRIDWKYEQNPVFPKGMQENNDDFKKTKYQQGTLASPYNQVIANSTVETEEEERINKIAIKESLYYTNIVPMDNQYVRLGLWNQLELQIRKWAWEKTQLFVTTGVIYLNGTTNGKLESSGALIPTHFYKIVTDPQNYGTVSYIIPNKEIYLGQNITGRDRNSIHFCNNGPCSLEDFIVTIQEVEKHTGIEFYPSLAPTYAAQVKLDAREMFKYKKRKLERYNEQSGK